MGTIKCVIFDWAGTTIDYGCFAPIRSFMEAFKEEGVEIKMPEAREPMGIKKADHIKAILEMSRVKVEFHKIKGYFPNDDDVKRINASFENKIMTVIPQHCDLIPGVKDVVAALRKKDIKIGSTTGYIASMMDIVVPLVKSKGYLPDFVISSSEVPAGRPAPYMIWRNLIELQIPDSKSVIKVGDTVADIKEGLNAGVLTAGVILGSSELGLQEEEVASMDKESLERDINNVRNKFFDAGADFVIDSISELPELIKSLDR